MNKSETPNRVASSAVLGDNPRPIYNDDGELTCDVCGKHELGLGWPTPHFCGSCAPKTKPCPFCGCWGAVWRIKENDDCAAWLECALCHARGPRVPLEGMAEHAWNRRKDAMSPNAEVSDRRENNL